MLTMINNSIVKPIIGITGHRTLFHDINMIKEVLKVTLKELNPEKILNGMAIGYDQLVADLCIEMNIPFVAAIPCLDQDGMWPPETKKHYRELLEYAYERKMVSGGTYKYWKMIARNKYIVDNSDLIVAYLDPNPISRSGTGTLHCVTYALEQNKDVLNLFEELEKKKK